MKSKPILNTTKTAILEAAWTQIGDMGRADVSQAEIAAAAGVSRQTIFYAFGNRTGLLTAMARYKDQQSDCPARMLAHARGEGDPVEALLGYTGVWLEYLPVIYPVAILLDADALTDRDARNAIDGRLVRALLFGFHQLVGRAAQAGRLRPGLTAEEVAEEIWCATHVSSWRRMVIDCGWTRERFVATRMALARSYFI